MTFPYLQIYALHQAGNYPEIVRIVETLLASQPPHTHPAEIAALSEEEKNILIISYFVRGVAKQALGDQLQEVEYLKAAIADYDYLLKNLNPDDATVYNNRGNVKKILGELLQDTKYLKAAIADFDYLLKNLNPNYAGAYFNRGLAKQKLGEQLNDENYWKAAIADYDYLLENLNPKDADTYNNRGNAKRALGELLSDENYLKAAIADYDYLLENLNPNHSGAYSNRGGVKLTLGERLSDVEYWKAAIADFDYILKNLNPNHAGAYLNRGNVQFALKAYTIAWQDYLQAQYRFIKIPPAFRVNIYNLLPYLMDLPPFWVLDMYAYLEGEKLYHLSIQAQYRQALRQTQGLRDLLLLAEMVGEKEQVLSLSAYFYQWGGNHIGARRIYQDKQHRKTLTIRDAYYSAQLSARYPHYEPASYWLDMRNLALHHAQSLATLSAEDAFYTGAIYAILAAQFQEKELYDSALDCIDEVQNFPPADILELYIRYRQGEEEQNEIEEEKRELLKKWEAKGGYLKQDSPFTTDFFKGYMKAIREKNLLKSQAAIAALKQDFAPKLWKAIDTHILYPAEIYHLSALFNETEVEENPAIKLGIASDYVEAGREVHVFMEQRVPKLLEAMTTYFATQQAAILEEIKTDWLTYDLPKIKTLAEWEGEMAKRIQSTNDARIVEKELYASYLLLTQSSVEIPIGNLLVLSLYLRYYHDKSQRIEENILGLLIGVFIGGLFSVVGIISAFIGEGADTMKEELKKRLLSTSKEDFVNFREHALVLLHMQFPQIAKKYENH